MFNLSDAAEANTSSQVSYQKPGIFDNVVISEVGLKHAANGSPYIRMSTSGANGEIGNSTRMFLGTEVKEGKKTSGWGVTARNLINLLMAIYNVEETS